MKDKIFQLVRENAMGNAVAKISEEDLKKIISLTEYNLGSELTGFGVLDKPYRQFYDEEALKSEFPKERLSKMVLDKCKEFGTKNALRVDKKLVTFNELYDNIINCAISLKKMGFKQGDVITMCTLSIPETIYLFFAANLLGGVIRPLDPISSPEVIKSTLIKTNSKFFVTLGLNYKNLSNVTDGTNVEKTIYVNLNNSMPGVGFAKKAVMNTLEKVNNIVIKKKSNTWIDYADVIKLSDNTPSSVEELETPFVDNEVIAIFSTSGSTGEPKGVCITNENFISSIYKQFASKFDVDCNDSVFNPMPSNSSYFWSDILFGALWGATVSLNPLFNPDDSPRQIIEDGSSVILFGPIIMEKMIDYLAKQEKKHKKVDLSHIKFFISGGDILTLDLENKFNEEMKKYNSKLVVNNALGTSETVGPAFNPNGMLKNQDSYMVGSVGVVLPGDDVGIFEYDAETMQRNVDSLDYCKGQLYYDIGEICLNCNNPTIFKEYYANAEETAKTKLTHADGTTWYHTGDLGYMDPAGHLFCSGRKSGLIVRAGHKVWAKKIENVINQMEGVVDCAIIGVPDKAEKETPALFIVFDSNVNVEVKNRVLNSIPMKVTKDLDEMHVPTFIHELDLIPRNIMMKVKIKDLFDLYLENKSTQMSNNKPKKMSLKIKSKS